MSNDDPIKPSSSTDESPTSGPVRPSETPRETPPTGRRQAFRDLRRQLTDEELRNPGVMKLVLDEFEKAEIDNEILRAYVDRFYQADKRAAVLEEKLKTATALEVFFAVGLAVGAMIVGLGPFLWQEEAAYGVLCLIVGGVLLIGSVIARFVKS
jgi:hypothetical protein